MNNDKGKLYYGTGIDNSQMRADAAESRNILRGISDTAVKEGRKIDNMFSQIGKTIVGVFTVQKAAEFTRNIVHVRGEIESLQKSFEILAGKTKGVSLFSEIKDFAVHTPMLLRDLAKGAQTLMSFNIEADKVMPILRAIGDIAKGDAQQFNSLVLAFSQMSSAGKLMGQDLLQMINAGFNPLSVISEKTGKSIGELKEEMSAGALSAEVITQAFMDAASEGGKFYGMLESQSKGVNGQLSNLEGAVDDALNAIGEKSQDIITGSIQGLTTLVQNLDKVGKVIAELIATYGMYKAALMTMTAVKKIATQVNAGYTISELAQYKALLLVEKAQKMLNATILKNPYVLAAAAVAALSLGIYKLATYETAAEKAQKKLNDAVKECDKNIASERAQVDILFARLKAAKKGTEEYEAARKAIISQYGAYLEGLSKEVSSLENVEAAYKAITEAAKEAARARAMESFTKEAADEYGKKVTDAREDLYDALKKQYKGKKGTDGIDLAETYYWKIVPVLEGKEEMADEIRQIIASLDKIHYLPAGDPMTDAGSFRKEDEVPHYRTNAAEDAIREAARARKVMNDVMAEARIKFGDSPVKADEESGTDEKPIEPVKNKKYWEDYLKEQQGALDAMTEAQLKTEEAVAIRKNIADAQKKIDAYSVKKTSGGGGSSEEDTIAGQTADRIQKIQDYKDAVSLEVQQAELEIRQAQIEAEEEGFSKQMKQNALMYDKMILENKKRQDARVEALRDARELEWENANPTAKKQGQRFDRSSVTAADLSQEQLRQLQEYEKIAANFKRNADKKTLQTMLEQYLTYSQKREEIEREFAEKRASFYVDEKVGGSLKEGVTVGNVEELNNQEEEALNAVDEQFAQREETYYEWCNQIATMTLEQLQEVLADAEEELKKIEKSGGASEKDVAVARAKVSKARETLNKSQAKNKLSPDKRSVKEWNDLYKALNDCKTAFDEIGESVGGVAGEIISTAGSIMSSTLSMINSIVTVVNMSSQGMVATASTASAAVQTVEKASVILAIISAALQIAMAIADLFNNDDEKQKEIEGLQDRIDQLQWELDHADIMEIRENAFNSLVRVRAVMVKIREEAVKAACESGNFLNALIAGAVKFSESQEMLKKSVNELATAYANVRYTADKALGEEKYKNAREQIENITKQQILIQQQIEEEKEIKDNDPEQIEEWEHKIEELGAEAIAIINEMVEDIIGGTSSDIAKQLGDAFFDAFQAGENAAEAWGDKVNDIVADILRKMMISKFLEEPLGEIFEKYKKKWFPDGQFIGIDAVIDSLNDFANDLNEVGDAFADILENLPDDIKNMLKDITAREASEKGIATASQESVDELSGRATAIQGHTYSICENTKMLLQTANLILQSVMNIETHVERLAERVAGVEVSVRDVKNTVNDIALHGLKLI